MLFSQTLIFCNSSVLKFNTFVRPNGSDGIVLASYGVGGKRSVGAVRGIGDSLESGGFEGVEIRMYYVGNWNQETHLHQFFVLCACL